MQPPLPGKKIPFAVGEKLEVVIADINPAEESLILAPKLDEETAAQMNQQQQQRPPRDERRNNQQQNASQNSNNAAFSLGDFLSDTAMEKLQNINK